MNLDEISEGAESFTVDSDSKAEWALKKIKEVEADYIRMESVCKEQIAFYEQKIKSCKQSCDFEVKRFEDRLREYFETVQHKAKATKTRESYRLPSGKLQLTYEKQVLKETDELLAFLKQSDLKEYIKTEESPKWGEFLKQLSIVDGRVVTQDGLLVEGVTIETEPVKFKVVVDR